jgi:hypothetical protein
MKYVKDLTLALRLISCYCSSSECSELFAVCKFHRGFEESNWPTQEKRIAQNMLRYVFRRLGRASGLLFTGEVVSHNTDILALNFYHYYSSRKGKALPITRHDGRCIALLTRNIGARWRLVNGTIRPLYRRYPLYRSGPGWLSRYSNSLRAGRSGDRIPVEARFFAPVQTGPGRTQPPLQGVQGLSRG